MRRCEQYLRRLMQFVRKPTDRVPKIQFKPRSGDSAHATPKPSAKPPALPAGSKYCHATSRKLQKQHAPAIGLETNCSNRLGTAKHPLKLRLLQFVPLVKLFQIGARRLIEFVKRAVVLRKLEHD